MSADFDVIMVDAREQGHSDGIATGFSQELLTEDAAGLIRALGPLRFNSWDFSVPWSRLQPVLSHSDRLKARLQGTRSGAPNPYFNRIGPRPTTYGAPRRRRRIASSFI